LFIFFLNLFSNDFYTQQQYNNVINNTSTVEVGCINKQLVKAYREYCKIIASPDGTCLYNSVSLVLLGSQHFMKILKLITAHTMVKHKSFFDALVQRDLHVNNCNFYIEESLQSGVWGRDMHIFALSIVLRRSINFYNHIGKSNEELIGGQAYCGVNIRNLRPYYYYMKIIIIIMEF
jgi:hypothetical protein